MPGVAQAGQAGGAPPGPPGRGQQLRAAPSVALPAQARRPAHAGGGRRRGAESAARRRRLVSVQAPPPFSRSPPVLVGRAAPRFVLLGDGRVSRGGGRGGAAGGQRGARPRGRGFGAEPRGGGFGPCSARCPGRGAASRPRGAGCGARARCGAGRRGAAAPAGAGCPDLLFSGAGWQSSGCLPSPGGRMPLCTLEAGWESHSRGGFGGVRGQQGPPEPAGSVVGRRSARGLLSLGPRKGTGGCSLHQCKYNIFPLPGFQLSCLFRFRQRSNLPGTLHAYSLSTVRVLKAFYGYLCL